MRQAPPDVTRNKDFASSFAAAAASVTSHAQPASDVMYHHLTDAAYYANYRAPVSTGVSPTGFGGMNDKLLGGAGNGGFQGYGGDPGSPLGGYGSGSAELQYKPTPASLHNGLRGSHQHDTTSTSTQQLTHRPPSVAAPQVQVRKT